jgi:hypothetical protein
MEQNNIKQVSIKFKPGAYGVYRSLNNKPWYALAEYVDNAIQSYLDNKQKLLELNPNYKLRIEIIINRNDDFIRIFDNAAGINYSNFLRAFEPANIPIDNTGLSEYGMGMKIASIWFSDSYRVRSLFLEETVERSVYFDLKKVMRDEKEELNVSNSFNCDKNDHYTEVILHKLSKNAPSGVQLSKVKEHLSSIYRNFLRSGELELIFNEESLIYIEPKILKASWYDATNNPEKLWKKEIRFSSGKYKIKGFVALLHEMSGINSGFSLFRRGRVIKGSHDEKFHPKILCGNPGSPRDKRLFGEFELDGFNVSFEKGSFQELEELDRLLELVKLELVEDKYSILKQGDYYRKVKSPIEERIVAEEVVKNIKKKESSIEYKSALIKTVNQVSSSYPILKQTSNVENIQTNIIDKFEQEIKFNGVEYKITFEFIHDKGFDDLYTLLTTQTDVSTIVSSKINLEHPFFANHTIFENKEALEPIIAIIKGLIISELFSMNQGTNMAGNLRLNLNKILVTL